MCRSRATISRTTTLPWPHCSPGALHANLLWRNWLNWVYQTTPYDLSEVPQLRAERRLGTDRSIRHAPCSPRDDQFLPFDTSGYGLK